MKLLLGLYKYFPWGGLQSDTLRFAQEAAKRGHQVCILTSAWSGPRPCEDIQVEIIKPRGFSNHRRMHNFARDFLQYRYRHGFDVALAMNRLPGADFYFAADSCMADWMPQKHSLLTLQTLPRYRTYLQQEAAICSPLANTRIMYIAPAQREEFMQAYQLPEERFIYLPPGIDERCLRPENAEELRRKKRAELGLGDNELMLLLVGSNFWLKGVDRVVKAIMQLPEERRAGCRFFLAGNDSPEKLRRMLQNHGAEALLDFLGPRDDVPELLLAADLMLHPARREGAGAVLLEAMAAGLPVLCSAACGFSPFVEEASGTVLSEPFVQQELNARLHQALQDLPELARKTRSYAKTQDFCARNRVAIDALEEFAAARQKSEFFALYDFSPPAKGLRHNDFQSPSNGFARVERKQGTWFTLAGMPLSLLESILAGHEQNCSAGRFLKSEPKRRLTRVEHQGHSYIVKEFINEAAWNYYRHGRASWQNSQRLRGYSAPCLAWLKQKRVEPRSFVIFLDLGDLNLHNEKHHRLPNLTEIYAAAGGLLARLHREGLYHADAKSTNFVVNQLCPEMQSPVLLVDSDKVKVYKRLPEKLQIKNLGQFLASTGELPEENQSALCGVFLRAYGESLALSDIEMKQLLQKVNYFIDSGRVSENNCKRPISFRQAEQ